MNNPLLRAYHLEKMIGDPLYLSNSQRAFIEDEFKHLSESQVWRLDEVACQADHVHALISFDGDGKSLRRFIKSHLTKALNDRFGFQQNWWAKGGTTKRVISDDYFHEVRRYIYDQKCER